MKLEETTLYPAMEPVTGHEDVEEGKVRQQSGVKGPENVVPWPPPALPPPRPSTR